MSLTLQNPLKDPSAELDYAFNWRPDTKPWLEADETIASYIVTPDTGITLKTHSEANGKVTVWLSGGTAGENYKVACLITTSAGRTDERTIWIKVVER